MSLSLGHDVTILGRDIISGNLSFEECFYVAYFLYCKHT